MIMELMLGQPMFNMPIENVPDMLAKAHLHLHSIDADSVKNSLEVAGIRQELYSIEDRLGWLVGQIESPSLEWLQPGLRWIVENRPEDPDRLVVCHGDFHPINILTKDGITKVLVTVAALSIFPEVPKVYWVQFINRYYDYYQRECPVDPVHVEYYEAFRCLKALLEGAEGHAAFCQPETMRILSEYFEKITSVCLTLPANLLTS
jgi:hypothetical protein